MPITQKFYPSFFQTALNETLMTTANQLECTMALFREGATFNKEHATLGDIDVMTLGIEASVKNLTVTLELDLVNERLNFIIPDVTWNSAIGEEFSHGIIWGNEGLLFMHFDFGEAQNPAGGFSLVANELCVPHINLSYSPGCP